MWKDTPLSLSLLLPGCNWGKGDWKTIFQVDTRLVLNITIPQRARHKNDPLVWYEKFFLRTA